MNLLFVCTGNTCRSPMAEALLKEAAPEFHVQSAGIYAHPGDGANEKALHVLAEKKIEMDHRAQMVTEDLLKWADYVLTMTEAHRAILHEQFPPCAKKVYTLKQFVEEEGGASEQLDVIDPFGGDVSIYRATMEELTGYIDKLVSKIKQ